ncbi:transcriptional regulator [Bacillus sp. CCB-MMP212]|uniref:transcriptional regulator n=1 Tax=Bacillus TaxID=1386 RepID=UPI0018CCD534|nr:MULTISPECIES: transcriptional regulator [Bacillus]MBG9714294.1 transcriptional regulator [Bacillus cereus]MCI4253024.1 transcriptional regulator [Bacillus sp. CCB-MMP212]
MMKSKIKKAIGGIALATALVTSALPVSAATEYVWVRDAYPGYDNYVFDSAKQRVQIWSGNNYFYVDCDFVEYGKCFVKK